MVRELLIQLQHWLQLMMIPSRAHRLLLATTVALTAFATAGAAAPWLEPRPGRPEPACVPAAIETLVLPGRHSVDEIRVLMSPASPATGAVDVRVDGGNGQRLVHLHGATSRGLQFDPPLVSDRFHVNVEPVLEAAEGSCVQRVVLLSGGVAVASVKP